MRQTIIRKEYMRNYINFTVYKIVQYAIMKKSMSSIDIQKSDTNS